MIKGSRVVDNVSDEEWVGELRSAWQLIINMAGKKKPLQKRRQQSIISCISQLSITVTKYLRWITWKSEYLDIKLKSHKPGPPSIISWTEGRDP